MHAFLRKLITEWRRLKLPVGEDTIVVAVSGGADSVSLLVGIDELKTLGKLKARLVAAHFNHRLRGEESDDDEQFVRELTMTRKIELAVGQSRSHPASNVEEGARRERYDFLENTAVNLGASTVLTAHTVNDQAETFLMNLIRGSGARGLGGMHPVRRLTTEMADTVLARPLLTWAHRRETEAFCHDAGISYRYDTMNEDESFKRVRIRKVLIPLLEDLNPRIIDRLSETAGLLQIESAELVTSGMDDLILSTLKKLGRADLYHTLRAWIEANRGNLRQIDLKHIQAIERLIDSRKSGKTVELPGGYEVVKHDGRLSFRKLRLKIDGQTSKIED